MRANLYEVTHAEIERFLDGDSSPLSLSIFREMRAVCAGVSKKILQNPLSNEIDEIFSIAVYNMVRGRNWNPEMSSFYTWWSAVVRNSIGTHVRNQKAHLRYAPIHNVVDTPGVLALRSPDESPEVAATRKDSVARLSVAIQSLNDDEKWLISNRFGLYELPNKDSVEIGRILGVNPSTVLSRVAKIVGKLRKTMREE